MKSIRKSISEIDKNFELRASIEKVGAGISIKGRADMESGLTNLDIRF